MMAIITISRGSYTRGKEIAEKTAQKLGYACISREVLINASKNFNIPEIKLIHAIEDAPSFFDRFTHGKEKYIAYIRAALFKQLKEDNIVYHGFAGCFFVKDLPQVLKVRIISETEDRIKIVMARDKIPRKEAMRRVKKVDDQRKKWGLKLYGIDPGDPSLYDLVVHINNIMVKDAVATICQIARLKQFQTTHESKRALEDIALAAKVETFLIDVKPRAEVRVEDGFVSLKTTVPPAQESVLVNKIGEVMKMIQEVKGIKIVTEKHPNDT
ncbi:MAG: cytidylate kinase-like family protein [Desulfobacteraceae bacterium]|nr:MAG: cytidylate kinase-like family protein [Desulfobacteraceae bacterium]